MVNWSTKFSRNHKHLPGNPSTPILDGWCEGMGAKSFNSHFYMKKFICFSSSSVFCVGILQANCIFRLAWREGAVCWECGGGVEEEPVDDSTAPARPGCEEVSLAALGRREARDAHVHSREETRRTRSGMCSTDSTNSLRHAVHKGTYKHNRYAYMFNHSFIGGR